MAIDGLEITPTLQAGGATAEFERMPVVRGVAVGNDKRHRCVALEPINALVFGRVAVDGVVQIKTADIEKLTFANVLFRDNETQWALVRLGDPAMKLCRTISAWNKNTLAELIVCEDGTPPNETQTQSQTIKDAVNKYADIGSGRFCSLAWHGNGYWYVVAAECT
jgi:hypothetical protein